MADLQVAASQELARPLKALVPLIKEAFEQAETAGMPYYRKAGTLLLEARDGSFDGRTAEFYAWAERSFGRKKTQVRNYINLVLHETKPTRARETDFSEFSSMNDFRRRGLGHENKPTIYPKPWHDDVKPSIERARREAERIREEHLTRQQERTEEQKLALRLIDIGYRVLAKELHPDHGGSRDAMTRLSRVRDRLKAHV